MTDKVPPVAPQIFMLMSKIMSDLDAVGKDKQNKAQGYAYRSADALYTAFHKVLADNNVFFVPKLEKIERIERPGREGGVLSFVTVSVAYWFFAPDGSSVACSVAGESMDSGDKATKKAMTSAVKTMLEQVFCLPTGDDAEEEQASKPREPLPDKLTCPKCGSRSAIPNRYGEGFYCLDCKQKLDDVIK